MALPAVSGAASGMAGTPLGSDLITLSNGLSLADVGKVFGAVTWDFGAGKVSEFSVPAVDLDGVLSKRGLLKAGVRLTYQGERWEVAAVERDYKGADVWLTFTARSQLARRLRTMTGPDKAVDVTPATWITSRVKRAGGVAVVEPGAKRRTVVQKRSQSVLAVIEALASDTGVSWCEFDGRVFVGTPWWAFQGKTNLPTWQASARGVGILGARVLDTVGFNSRSSLDDRTNEATADLLVTARSGIALRPWHRVEVVHADEQDTGLWLVSNVAFGEGDPGVRVSLTRPLKSSPKKGSQGTSSGGVGGAGDPAALEGEWIADADRRYPGCSRTPREIVAFARSQVGNGFRQSGCLAWMSIAARGSEGLGGYSARYVWGYAPAGAAKSAGDTNPPIGAIVVWGRGAGQGHGHIGVSIGGGRFISATGGAVQNLPIAGFTSDYLGAMVPNFGGSYPNYAGAPGP